MRQIIRGVSMKRVSCPSTDCLSLFLVLNEVDCFVLLYTLSFFMISLSSRNAFRWHLIKSRLTTTKSSPLPPLFSLVIIRVETPTSLQCCYYSRKSHRLHLGTSTSPANQVINRFQTSSALFLMRTNTIEKEQKIEIQTN